MRHAAERDAEVAHPCADLRMLANMTTTSWMRQAAVVLLLCAACFAGGSLANEYFGLFGGDASPAAGEQTPQSAGGGEIAKSLSAAGKEQLVAELNQRYGALGYLGGYEPAPLESGVIRHDPQRAFQALNFYTSSHALAAYLIDMDGRVLHIWQPAQTATDDATPGDPAEHWWRRAHVYPRGELLVIEENRSLTKLDKDSREIWKLNGNFHHDLHVLEDGRIFVLDRVKDRVPYFRYKLKGDDDRIKVLDRDGQLIRELSILDAFDKSEYSGTPRRTDAPIDILHTNTIEVLDGRLAQMSDAFKRGNVLVSCLAIDTIAVIDMEQEAVVWALSGMWQAQHQPTVLDNGNMLLFDNRGHHDQAKIIEFNPFTQQLVWSYKGPNQQGLPSHQLGSNQRLPNGNTLITDSVNGRAFEITQSGETVWEFVNPARYGESDELIAVLYEVVRLDPEFAVDWIPEPSGD